MDRQSDGGDERHSAPVNDGRKQKRVSPPGPYSTQKIAGAPDSNRSQAAGRRNVLGSDGHGMSRVACSAIPLDATAADFEKLHRNRRRLSFPGEQLAQDVLQNPAIRVVESFLRRVDAKNRLKFPRRRIGGACEAH